MSELIRLESVSRRFGSRAAVCDLSFSVSRGEIVGLLGPNGAGKTTTLRMIAGEIAASEGRVSVAGFDMAEDNLPAARRIGYLPEHPPLYDTLDVHAFLDFVARAKGLSGARKAAELERVTAACRLGEVYRAEIYKLSKGYRQRLGLAQALLGSPDVLLLDEPTAGLDPAQIQETRDIIRSHGGGHAVLLSTHLLAEATLICQRVAIVDRGRLLAIDAPAALQRAFEEADCVVIEVAAPAAGLREALLALQGVAAVRIRPATGAGTLEVECEVGSRDGMEALIAARVSRHWPLGRLERRRPSLENVFLRYVNADAKRGEGP